MLGISTYFKDLDYEYLEKASKIGAKYLFTSLHIPEEDLSDLSGVLPEFLSKTNEYGLLLVPDISPATFEKLNVAEGDYEGLKALGFKTLRLDYGFEDYELVKKLQEDFELILNGSVVKEKDLLEAKAAGVDLSAISVMHNFYPKTDTGLSLEYFKKMNEVFVRYDIKSMAFVQGDKLKRFPLYEGLPTVEKHRQMHPFVAAVELIHECGINDILIGDSEAKFETLEWIQSYMEDKVMHIPAHFDPEYKEFYENTRTVRRDLSDSVIRVISPRIEGIEIKQNGQRRKGSITMENQLSGRYSGEVQIVKQDFPMSARTNVIGFVHPDFVDIFDFIDHDTKIKFIPFE